MNQKLEKGRNDLPWPIAVVALLLVLVLLFAGSSFGEVAKQLEALGPAFDDNIAYLSIAFISLTFSLAWVSSQYRRIVRLTKQGSRLKAILGETPTRPAHVFAKCCAGSATAGAVFVIGVFAVDGTRLPFRMTDVQSLIWSAFELGAAFSVAIGAFVLVVASYSRLTERWGRRAKLKRSLPPFPSKVNSVTLGSIGDDTVDASPAWLTLGERALNGNVLITGSIGAGKTQGTILTYFDQIMANFSTRPSVLAIDPKGTFVPEALKILERHGVVEHCVHLKLDGQVKFNPIYVPNALTQSRFVDIAYMIQAAGTNFLGSSQDSKFWELNAFNLIRHALVHCAASNEYYTLLDLYETIVASVSEDLPEKIQLVLDTKELGQEERFNVMRAYDYFALEFRKLDERVKTSILTTSTAFLNQFQEFHASRIFCPTSDEARIQSLDEVVDGGKILLFDVASVSLAKSMGTVMKLLYQKSLLDRLKDEKRGKKTPGLLLIDEYQDVVTTSHGSAVGDDRFLAKGREANAISIMATQSLTSLQDAIGKDASAKSLIQCFRTRIAGHSSDIATIQAYQELVGQEEKERVSHSVSELSQDAKLNHVLGGFESNNANISESVSKSTQKESTLTGKEFTALTSFESFALVYDGIRSQFHRLFLKPYFLQEKSILHADLLSKLATAVVAVGISSTALYGASFPNICSVVRTPDFSPCMEFKVSTCECGYPPHPCAQFNYYVPTSFVEVHPNAGETFFGALPAARGQLSALSSAAIPYGAEADNDTQSFQAHTLAIPLASTVMSQLPCSASFNDTTCFEAMSEHLGTNWTTGAADQYQPNFLAWMAAPKPCLLVGAATSLTGGVGGSFGGGNASCSVANTMQRYPPSAHFACNGWGVFYPRTGVYNGVSQTAGALMVAARLKSLASEVFQSTKSSPGEKWQMILPQASGCFREGENVLPLETFRRATEIGRLSGGPTKGHLFAIWQSVSCCKEMSEVPTSQAVLAAMQAACQAGGGP